MARNNLPVKPSTSAEIAPGAPPVPARSERVSIALKQIVGAHNGLVDALVSDWGVERSLHEARQLVQSGDLERVRSALRGASAPASMEQIGVELGRLIASYPNVPKSTDLSVYGRCLVQDIASLRAPLHAIEAACRHLRRTNKFLPAIAEIFELVEREASRLKDAADRVERLEDTIVRAEQRLALEAKRARESEEREVAHQELRRRAQLEYEAMTRPPLEENIPFAGER